jgi:hypothetical protein
VDNPTLFTNLPVLTGNANSTSRGLTYRINGTLGIATFRLTCRDNGGTALGGLDSTVKNFVIRINQPVSNQKIWDEATLQIWPNPTQENLYLNGLSAPVEYEVLNLQGKILMDGYLALGESIPVGKIGSGMYLLRIRNDQQQSLTMKWMKY